ncbi:hypothetical protein [Cellulomonas bogoriensis]|uniref:ATPase n=1 Tax=Cellulomonas bogoriensis 69B4 = DSM 16987 TaxID=1386082 RepID=A0A0A0BXG9_9CELL|nr:hypothetical protein [Cellulomonas bogoriensis]KGM13098.1 hypothetical protein N869_16255 [Cellulomonas bogoriensis 69B4 = DSM 16987]
MNGEEEQASQPEQGLEVVLQELEQVVTGARAMPMSSSVLVSRPEVLELLERARQVLPDQLARADDLLTQVDRVQAEAREEAARIVAEARAQAARLVSAEDVLRAATHRAQEVVDAAEATAGELRRDADDYCDRRLADFEIDLGKVLAQVQAGRAKLAGRLGDTPVEDPPT